MRTLFLTLAALMIGAAPVLADGPATTPVPQPTVLVFPFQPMGQVSGHEWLRAALQEDIVSEMHKSGLVQTHSMRDPLVSSDSDKAIAAGRDAGADLVIFGSYQIVGDQLRVTGQMTQVSTGAVVMPLSATGTTLDVFKVEDTLGEQMQPAVARLYAPQNQPVVEYGVQPNPITQTDNAAPLQSVVVPQQPVYYTAPTTVYVQPYSYSYLPYASSCYPSVYFGGSVFYGSRFNHGVGTFGRGFTSFNRGFNHGGDFHGGPVRTFNGVRDGRH